MDANEEKFLSALLIAASIIGLILVFFIVSIIRYHNYNMRLYRDKIALEIETLEKERVRIATDLHDHFGPMLSAVKLKTSVLQGCNEQDIKIITELKEHVNEIVGGIRIISGNLRPNTLERHGLIKALMEFVQQIDDVSSIHFLFECYTQRMQLPKEAELHVFRIVQEIVNNTLKHSEASTCTIGLDKRKNKIRLIIEDNGKGFDFDHCIQNSSGCGLKNIVNRIEMLKGILTIDSKQLKGATYLIEIPLKHYEQRKNQSGYCR